MADILNQIQTIDVTGIIYCGTQVKLEIYSKWLEFNGIKATFYNARLDRYSRIHIEKGLMTNEYKCVVPTNALGMGNV